MTKEYVFFHNMNTRAKNDKYSKLFPTYIDCKIDFRFTEFNFFVEWCRNQIGFDNIGWVLDKDILNEDKMYHPDTCVFIPLEINAFFTCKVNTNRDITLPVGVTWSSSEGKYKVYCSVGKGKNKTLGRFLDAEEAGVCYINFKNLLARELASTWKGLVDPRVTEVLNNYDVRNFTPEGVTTHSLYQ